MSFRLVRNPSEERCWTSQHDRNKESPQQRLWGIENLIKIAGRNKDTLDEAVFEISLSKRK